MRAAIMMHILLKTPTGRTFTIEFEPTDTVQSVYARTKKEEKINCPKLRQLQFRTSTGTILRKKSSLSDYVEDGSTLTLRIRGFYYVPILDADNELTQVCCWPGKKEISTLRSQIDFNLQLEPKSFMLYNWETKTLLLEGRVPKGVTIQVVPNPVESTNDDDRVLMDFSVKELDTEVIVPFEVGWMESAISVKERFSKLIGKPVLGFCLKGEKASGLLSMEGLFYISNDPTPIKCIIDECNFFSVSFTIITPNREYREQLDIQFRAAYWDLRDAVAQETGRASPHCVRVELLTPRGDFAEPNWKRRVCDDMIQNGSLILKAWVDPSDVPVSVGPEGEELRFGG